MEVKSVKLTNEILARYVGGQMETQNPGQSYLYRGEIEKILIEAGEIKVRFTWLARGEGYPPYPQKWVKAKQLDYSVELKNCRVSDIGQGRIIINVPGSGELSTLFPPGGSRLDPAKVEGF